MEKDPFNTFSVSKQPTSSTTFDPGDFNTNVFSFEDPDPPIDNSPEAWDAYHRQLSTSVLEFFDIVEQIIWTGYDLWFEMSNYFRPEAIQVLSHSTLIRIVNLMLSRNVNIVFQDHEDLAEAYCTSMILNDYEEAIVDSLPDGYSNQSLSSAVDEPITSDVNNMCSCTHILEIDANLFSHSFSVTTSIRISIKAVAKHKRLMIEVYRVFHHKRPPNIQGQFIQTVRSMHKKRIATSPRNQFDPGGFTPTQFISRLVIISKTEIVLLSILRIALFLFEIIIYHRCALFPNSGVNCFFLLVRGFGCILEWLFNYQFSRPAETLLSRTHINMNI